MYFHISRKMNKMYSVKVKISKPSEKEVSFKNLFLSGIVVCRNPTEAKNKAIKCVMSQTEEKNLQYSIVDCKKIKTDFVINEN